MSADPHEEICVLHEFQKRGTTFPIEIDNQLNKEQLFALMDTGAMQSCINYATFEKLKGVKLSNKEVPRVLAGSNTGIYCVQTIKEKYYIGSRLW